MPPKKTAPVKRSAKSKSKPTPITAHKHADKRKYIPDFIARVNDGHGPGDMLNLLLETSGEPRKDKAAKVATARNLWVPAINNHGGFGRWAFLEITDPWDAQNTIRALLNGKSQSDRSNLI